MNDGKISVIQNEVTAQQSNSLTPKRDWVEPEMKKIEIKSAHGSSHLEQSFGNFPGYTS